MEPCLAYVLPEDLRTQDFVWMGQSNKASAPFNRFDPSMIWDRLHEGSLHLFRLKPPHEGVVLVEVVERNGCKRLVIWLASGRGIARVATKIARLLQQTAAEWGCEAVETMVVNPRFARAIMRSGARAESVILVLPVGDS